MEFRLPLSMSRQPMSSEPLGVYVSMLSSKLRTKDPEWFSRAMKNEQISRFRESKSGASAIEFAICCPMLFMLLLGILCYGIYIGACHSVAQLAADAARASVAGLSQAERQAIALDHVSRSVGNYPLLKLTNVTVIAAPAANNADGYRVSVRYDASDLPLWFVFIPSPSPTIERAAVIINGGN